MRLFEPIRAGAMQIPNRVMVPAMVTHLCSEDGLVNEEVIARYARYAAGGAGLIVVEAMAVHQVKSGPLLRISDASYIPGLRELARRVHQVSDSKIVPQIIHFLKAARSGWRQTVDMLSAADIDRIVEQFGDAVARAREAGFDGAELHAAHAYTLSSFLSRTNPRGDEQGGRTLEGRLRLVGRVMENVRRKAGDDFPVGVRFNGEEHIKSGYSVDDAKLIALRLAELGASYLSLSAGGKFEDAVHTPGQVLFPYSGYSGDRAMPGDWLPRALNVGVAAEVKRFLLSRGHRTPVAVAGKLSDPAQAERVLADGAADLVAIARGLLADPDWPRKVKRGALEQIVQCDYCNVCKTMDGAHKPVTCTLWPKDALQAPAPGAQGTAPRWSDGGGLGATQKGARVVLSWRKASGAEYYDVYRSEGAGGEPRFLDAVKATLWTDAAALGGRTYGYAVRARDASGRAGPLSDAVVVETPAPVYA